MHQGLRWTAVSPWSAAPGTDESINMFIGKAQYPRYTGHRFGRVDSGKWARLRIGRHQNAISGRFNCLRNG
jgi:hypothetical protein